MPGETTILLIEDDRDIASTIDGVLKAAGYNVLFAHNGVEGRRLIDATRLEQQLVTFQFIECVADPCFGPKSAPNLVPGEATRATLVAVEDDIDLWLGAAGIRVEVNQLLLSGSVLFNLGDEGLQDEGAIAVVSVDYTF